MQINNWKVKINERIGYMTRNVFIFRDINPDQIEILQSDNIIKTFNYGQEVPATIVLDDDMLQAFVEALDNKGFKAKEGFLEGKIEATEKHLEDMRKIVFPIKK